MQTNGDKLEKGVAHIHFNHIVAGRARGRARAHVVDYTKLKRNEEYIAIDVHTLASRVPQKYNRRKSGDKANCNTRHQHRSKDERKKSTKQNKETAQREQKQKSTSKERKKLEKNNQQTQSARDMQNDFIVLYLFNELKSENGPNTEMLVFLVS